MGAIKTLAKIFLAFYCLVSVLLVIFALYFVLFEEDTKQGIQSSGLTQTGIFRNVTYNIPELDFNKRSILYSYPETMVAQDYIVDAHLRGNLRIGQLDYGNQAAKMLTKLDVGYNLSDEFQLYYFLNKINYGVCRHKSNIGFNLLNSDKNVWLVSGFCKHKEDTDKEIYAELAINHDWLVEIDDSGNERIIDLSLG